MAYGYAYALLGDAHLAEDAAQEAFIVAWRRLEDVRNPDTFPGWLRSVVRTQCDRMTRGKRLSVVPLVVAAEVRSATLSPDAHAES
jgi:DNA-directed RNA polymerase specialized sigma24 family protein